MNLPNKLTLVRMVLVPFFMFFILLPNFSSASYLVCDIVAAVIFGAASLTDMLDGKIARKYGLVTDFGKFMDPIADKLMVFGAFFAFSASDAFALYRTPFAVIAFIVFARDLAVTSLRTMAQNKNGTVIAAAMPGKIKTVSQIVFILFALLERHIFAFSDFFATYMPITVTACLVMLFFAVYSGIDYFRAYGKFLKESK